MKINIVLDTHYVSVFKSTETTRTVYSCIFYFVDNGIVGIEESSELFIFLFPVQPSKGSSLNILELQSSSDLWSSSDVQ